MWSKVFFDIRLTVQRLNVKATAQEITELESRPEIRWHFSRVNLFLALTDSEFRAESLGPSKKSAIFLPKVVRFFNLQIVRRSFLAESACAISFIFSSDSVRLLFNAFIWKGRSAAHCERSRLRISRTWYWSFVRWILVLSRLLTMELVCLTKMSRREMRVDVMLKREMRQRYYGLRWSTLRERWSSSWESWRLRDLHLTWKMKHVKE